MSKKVDFNQAKPLNLDGNAQAKINPAIEAIQKRNERKGLRIDCLHLVIGGKFSENAEDAIRQSKELYNWIVSE